MSHSSIHVTTSLSLNTKNLLRNNVSFHFPRNFKNIKIQIIWNLHRTHALASTLKTQCCSFVNDLHTVIWNMQDFLKTLILHYEKLDTAINIYIFFSNRKATQIVYILTLDLLYMATGKIINVVLISHNSPWLGLANLISTVFFLPPNLNSSTYMGGKHIISGRKKELLKKTFLLILTQGPFPQDS